MVLCLFNPSVCKTLDRRTFMEERNSTCSREEPEAPRDCNENLLVVSEEAVLQERVSQPGCYCLRSAPKVGHVGTGSAGDRVCKTLRRWGCARLLRRFSRLLVNAACEVKSMLIYPLINCCHGVCVCVGRGHLAREG